MTSTPLVFAHPTMAAEPLPSGITTELTRDGDGVVLIVAGEIDLRTALQFESALAEGQKGAPSIVVDLREVTFMGSTGLRALLGARRRAQGGGGEVALRVRPDGPVARMLELAGVKDLFPRRDGDG